MTHRCWVSLGSGVCQRVARCRCSENIPDDILTEILSQQVDSSNHRSTWMTVHCPGVGCCGLGGGVEGLGPIRPSARGNTIPREERGAEVKFVILFLLSILFCYRLSYTQPFRNSVVDGDGVYTGEDTLVRYGKRLAVFFRRRSGGIWVEENGKQELHQAISN